MIDDDILDEIESETEEKKGKFKLLKANKLEDVSNGEVKEIKESDLTIQTDTHLVQYEYVDGEKERKKYLIKPGIWTIEETAMGTVLDKFELRQYELLKSIDNTKVIMSEADKFFDKLHLFGEDGPLKGREPKRSILLCSPPGVGKTASINEVCKKLLVKKGACVVTWDTAGVRARTVNSFFLNGSTFSKETKYLVFIMEDVSGGTTEEDYGAKGVNSSLLNLLDGVGSPFKGVPTFIIATTNNPEREVGALIDRPGRFDKVIELKTPNEKECIELLGFIAKKELSEDDIKAAKLAAEEEFSIAHLQEIVVRGLLDDITMLEACEQLVDHKKRFKNAFQEEKKIGMGF